MIIAFRKIASLLILSFGLVSGEAQSRDADVIIVGGGIAGLSAALELGRGGANVLIFDMNSVPGGHAVLAGGYALVGTPLQESLGIEDSPDLAFRDLMAWGETNDPRWTRYYVNNSRELVYDWLVDLGVEFVQVLPSPSYSVPRFHFTKGTSAFVIVPLLKEIFRYPSIEFIANSEVRELKLVNGAVVGVAVRNLRSGVEKSYESDAVVVATGGYQSNLDFVRETWRTDAPFPSRILVGSGQFANGSGYELARQAGAALTDLNKQMTFPSGIPNPRDPDGNRALLANNPFGAWLNMQGERFVAESDTAKFTVPIIARQERGTYWLVFDQASRDAFGARGALWLTPQTIEEEILNNENIAKVSQSLEDLASKMEISPAKVIKSVEGYNWAVETERDDDFGRPLSGDAYPFAKIETPPFYAIQQFLVTRKSMGGIKIDMAGGALDDRGSPVAGLYAAGEVTGVAGINGNVGMSGTFLGPSVMIGRVAAQSLLREVDIERARIVDSEEMPEAITEETDWSPSLAKVDLIELLESKRQGYWHFETSHELVLERDYGCEQCHSSSLPMAPAVTRSQMALQVDVCTTCHN